MVSYCLRYMWLSRVKYALRVTFGCFELGPRLHPDGDDKLATRNLRLENMFFDGGLNVLVFY